MLIHNWPASDLVVVVVAAAADAGQQEGKAMLRTLRHALGAVDPAVRLVDDNKPPKPLRARCSDLRRPYLPHLARWLVDEVREVGSWVLRMARGRYRVERSSGAGRKTVDQVRIRLSDVEVGALDWLEEIG